MIELGVNIDHVATLRQARRGFAPDVIAAAKICELTGVDQITVHLRADRRHIQDADVYALKQTLLIRMNLEMAAVPEIIAIAHDIKPETVCIVPEKREEITTEGGLDVAGQMEKMTELTQGMHENNIKVSMFIDPEPEQIEASAAVGADYVELHTGAYANSKGQAWEDELKRLWDCADIINQTALRYHAGHGLTVRNLMPVALIPTLREVNIGHDIIARAIFIGLENAIKEIKEILQEADRRHCCS